MGKVEAYAGKAAAQAIQGTELYPNLQEDAYIIGGGELIYSIFTGALPGKKGAKGDSHTSVKEGSSYTVKDRGSEAPYNSQITRNDFESTYGHDNVVSTTVPPVGAKNVNLAGKRHPVTGIVFDKKGFPIFDDIAAFDTRISIKDFKAASYEGQMKLATKDLWGAIQSGQVKDVKFTDKQLRQIESGAKKIDGYTWHHHQDSGRMQLVPALVHSKTGHIGGDAMGGGK
ncbi:hypothetical protein C3L29_030835 [Pseudomonas sp. MWU12-2534b]|nr:hypothetical protein C3L29_030835 [Pseudomonas sp. MWU12-2534b]